MHAAITRRLASDACLQSRSISYLQKLSDTLEHFHNEILRRASIDPNILKRKTDTYQDTPGEVGTRLDTEDVRSKKRLQVLRTVRGDNVSGLSSGVSKQFATAWKRSSEYDEYDFMLYYERRDRSMWAYSTPKNEPDKASSSQPPSTSRYIPSSHNHTVQNNTIGFHGNQPQVAVPISQSASPKQVHHSTKQEDAAKRITHAAAAVAISSAATQPHDMEINGHMQHPQDLVSNLFGRNSNSEGKTVLENLTPDGVTKALKTPSLSESDTSIIAPAASQNHAMLDGELSSDGEGEDRVSFSLPSPYSPYNGSSSPVANISEVDSKVYRRSQLTGTGISSLNIASPPYPVDLTELPKSRLSDKHTNFESATVRNADASKHTTNSYAMDSSSWSFIPGMRSVTSSGVISRHPPRPVPARSNPDWSSIFGSHIPSKNSNIGSELSRLLSPQQTTSPSLPKSSIVNDSDEGKAGSKNNVYHQHHNNNHHSHYQNPNSSRSSNSQSNRSPPSSSSQNHQRNGSGQTNINAKSNNSPTSQKESRSALTSLAALVGSAEGLSKEAVISVFSRQPGAKKR